MTFEQYVRAVETEDYPDDPKVPAGPDFHNDAGTILNVAFGSFGGMASISTDAGALRSNHFHKTDWHYLHVTKGIIDYWWRQVGSGGEPLWRRFFVGETFFTPPLVEHAVFSPVASRMISLSKLARRSADHEADLVRVKLIEVVDGKARPCP